MDEAAVRGDVGQRPPAPGDLDRIEALEQQVRQLTSRLAGWVEAQLVQSLDDRRNEMKALRAELQVIVNEQLAGMRAEASSVLTVATRRLEVAQEQLAERLDTVAERAADAATRSIALSTASTIEGERLDIVEQQVAQRLALVQEQAKAELAAAGDRQRAEIEALRADMATSLAGVPGAPAVADGLEQRVRSAMSRLSDSVENRLGEVVEARRSDLDALRTELTAVVDERASQTASASSSAVATTLGRRLDDVASRMAETADEIAALKAEAEAGPTRIEEFEQRVKTAMVRLTDSVETRLTESLADRSAGLDALRTELADRVEAVRREVTRTGEVVAETKLAVRAGGERSNVLEQQMNSAVARLEESIGTRLAEQDTARGTEIEQLRADMAETALTLGERVDDAALRTAAVATRVGALGADAEAAAARTEELEQRVKAAVGRLAESVEERMGEAAAAQSAQLRAEVETAATALRARFVQVHERVEAVEQRHRAAEEHLDQALEAKVEELVERRRAEFDALKQEIEARLAGQLRGARAEIATAVAEAHRRFIVSVDQLHERMNIVADQSTAAHAAVTQIETLQETVTSDGRRLEALEIHTRRTDARLGDVVDEKLSEQAARRGSELEGLQAQLIGAQAELRAALAAHLAETRAELTLALGRGRQELIDGIARMEQRQATIDEEAARALADLDALAASVQVALRKGEDRLGATVQAKAAELEAVAARAAANREEIDASVASVARKVARVHDQVQKSVAVAVERMDALAAAAAMEAGTLAPMRSDLRRLQAQVAELAESVAQVRPKRTAAPAKKSPAAPAKKRTAAPAKKRTAAPAKKAPAAPRKAAGRATKHLQ